MTGMGESPAGSWMFTVSVTGGPRDGDEIDVEFPRGHLDTRAARYAPVEGYRLRLVEFPDGTGEFHFIPADWDASQIVELRKHAVEE